MGTEGHPEPAEIEARVIAFLERELLPPGVSVGQDDELLAGLLDSVAVLRLAAFVEEEFRLKMEPADFVIENFQTVGAVAAYVRRANDPGQASPGAARP